MGESALSKCIQGGHDACLDAMLKAGAPVNAVNRSTGDTALIVAAGRSALHRACDRGHAEAAKLLIQSGAAIDIDDTSGCTPLMLAAGGGHAETVRILLCAGASVSIADRKGE